MTPKELETLKLVASGYKYGEISRMVYVSTDGIKHRMGSARKKLGARTNEQAVYIACKRGLM